MEARECRFGMWLKAEKLAGRATLPAFKTVDDAHRQIHELAAEIVASRARLQLGNLRAPARSPQLQ
ncbi:MAG: CZB domain-containing protein [Acidobacteriota bacterium]|nr:CZB domain-containing protein [Acidobacteriota bacterium]